MKRADDIAGAGPAEELFRIVLAGADVGITVQDRAHALVYANQAAAEILGFATPAALLAASVGELLASFEVFHPDGRPFALDELPSRAALEGRSGDEVLLRFRIRHTREERWSLVRAVPVFDAGGAVAHAINFFREITAAKREEERHAFLLRASHELAASLDYERTLAAVARLAVPTLADWCAVDLIEGDRVHRVAIEHVDPSKLAIVRELERRYPSDPDGPRGLGQLLRTGTPQLVSAISPEMIRVAAFDDEHKRLIDALELCSYLAVPLRVRGTIIGALTFAMAESGRRHQESDLRFALDLADRAALAIENARLYRHVEEMLAAERERRADAEDASRFAELFIGVLGHDLRNPLTAVIMGTQVLKQQAAGDSTMLERIQASAERMAAMVSQLLDLTRSRLLGGISIDRSRVDLGAVVTRAIDELRLAHPGRAIAWEPRAIWGAWDRDRLAQVASNLIGNALEHGDPDGAVTVELTRDGDRARLTVHNLGAPIPPELLAVIFDPHRPTTARSESSTGLGLGLYISHQIVEAHDGRITVTSSATQGTTFVVELPGVTGDAAIDPDAPAPRRRARPHDRS